MDCFRFMQASLCANIAAFLFPLRNEIFGLIFLFSVNFLFGLLADICNQRDWSFKKAFRLFRDAAVYFTMVASIYLLGYLKGEEVATMQCVSFLTYVAIYFYGTNILRNARMITQEQSTLFRILDFLYYVLSLRIVKRSDYLKGYMSWYEKEHNKKL